MLRVKILGAQLVKDKDIIGKMDPYVILTVGSQKYQTRVANGMGRTPIWNDEFILNVSPHDVIQLKVYDSDIGIDDFVGETKIPVSQLGQAGVVDNYFPLQSRFLKRNAGQIHIRFEWSGTQQNYGQQVQSHGFAQQQYAMGGQLPYGIPAPQYQQSFRQQEAYVMPPQVPPAFGNYPIYGQQQYQPQFKPDQYGQMPTSGPLNQLPQQGYYQGYGQQQGPGFGYNQRPY
jgi:hypothetical protein